MDYTNKYLKYKSKYLELKELIAGGKNKKETELMAYIKANIDDLDTLSKEKNNFDKDNNLPLFIYINNTDTIDMRVISFLLPDDESLLAKKNNNGDTIMHLVVKKNNLDLLEDLWSSGGRGAKLVTNKAGLNLLNLAKTLEKSDKKYKKITNFLRYVYNKDNDKAVDSLLSDRQIKKALLKASSFVKTKSSVKSNSPTSFVKTEPKIKIINVDEKIANKSEDYSVKTEPKIKIINVDEKIANKSIKDYDKSPSYLDNDLQVVNEDPINKKEIKKGILEIILSYLNNIFS